MKSIAVILLAATAVPLVAQTSDTTPPQVVSFSFSPASVDVSTAGKTVAIDATITDDLSGFSNGYVMFTSPRGQDVGASFYPLSPTGSYRVYLSIPRYSEAGVWKAYVHLEDAAGNKITLNAAALASLGFPTNLTVTNTTPDTTPPALLGIGFAPTAVDVSAGSADVNISLHLTDDIAGVGTSSLTWFMLMLSPPGAVGSSNTIYVASTSFQRVSGTVFDGIWRAVVTVPKNAPAGGWTVQRLQLYDGVRNTTTFTNALLVAAGMNPVLQVSSTPQDITAPSLTGLSFSPSLFNTSVGPRTMTMTISASDDLSGVSYSPTTPYIGYIQFGFISPSGNQTVYISPFLAPTMTGGTPQNGTWQTTATWPQYSEEGTWHLYVYQFKDAAGNVRSYSPAMLQAMGLPNTIVVTKPSLLSDGTIGPSGGTVTDNSFGNRASVTFPAGVATGDTSVAIDVFANALAVPTPQGFTTPGTYFTNISFTPPLPSPLPAPGITIVLPLLTPMTPGAKLSLFHIDPISGKLAPAMNASRLFVIGYVNADGLSATFYNVVTLSTAVAYLSNGSVMGDVDGNGKVDCVDISLVKASFGKPKGQPGFNLAADINNDGVVDIRDLFIVMRQLPAGTTCQ